MVSNIHPHILCLKSSGTPYLLFLTQINNINYSFLIDKKTKQGYDYPKIFVLPYQFDTILYNGTLFETELLRDNKNNWSLLLGDIYMLYGEVVKGTIIIERINHMHSILQDQFIKTDFWIIFPLSIKKYFDLKNLKYSIEDFSDQLPYDIRGIYFIPIRPTFSNTLYLFPRQNIAKQKTKEIVLRIVKTPKPDIYELYAKGEHNLIKKGNAYVKDIKQSLYLHTHTNTNENVNVTCIYNNKFKKWEPRNVSTETISLSKDVLI